MSDYEAQHLTRIFLVVLGLAILAWEVLMLTLGLPAGTISWTVADLSTKYKFIPLLVVFALGMIVGHIWWPL